MLSLIIFIICLAVLIYTAKLVTDSASHFARVFGASEFIVGATVVALGTSLPELSSSLAAMSSGLTEIVIGNVVGSNIANIALILGLTGIFYVLKTERDILKTDVPFFIGSAIITLIVLLDFKVTFSEGIILIVVYFSYLANSMITHKEHNGHKKIKLEYIQIVWFLLGLAGLIYSARYLIISSVDIMSSLGISEAIIGFILIAVGTSLPELSTSIVAARKGKIDMVLGNIIGSNIFNSLVVLGASALVADVKAGSQFIYSVAPAMVFLTILLSYMIRDRKITRFESGLLLMLYLIIIVRTISVT
ncbi:MAG: calcium/sodium antiporter [archaeon]